MQVKCTCHRHDACFWSSNTDIYQCLQSLGKKNFTWTISYVLKYILMSPYLQTVQQQMMHCKQRRVLKSPVTYSVCDVAWFRLFVLELAYTWPADCPFAGGCSAPAPPPEPRMEWQGNHSESVTELGSLRHRNLMILQNKLFLYMQWTPVRLLATSNVSSVHQQMTGKIFLSPSWRHAHAHFGFPHRQQPLRWLKPFLKHWYVKLYELIAPHMLKWINIVIKLGHFVWNIVYCLSQIKFKDRWVVFFIYDSFCWTKSPTAAGLGSRNDAM